MEYAFLAKSELRPRLRARRSALREGPEGAGRCRRMQRRLLAGDLWSRSRRVVLYCAVKGEPDTALLLEAAWRSGREVFLPRCRPGQPGEMDLAACAGSEELRISGFGIPEPELNAESRLLSEAELQAGEETLLVVPGLAFDRRGHRLGYGGGYYDRLLARAACSSVGLCFGELVLPELPLDAWDRAVSFLCTEDGLFCPAASCPGQSRWHSRESRNGSRGCAPAAPFF